MDFKTIIDPEQLNLAEQLEDDKLNEIGQSLKKGFEVDLASRKEWDDACSQWVKMAMQYKEEKSFPWPGAANVKYPLVTTSAMQFGARAYPALVNGKEPVRSRIIGPVTPESQQIADKIGKHMSYQLMDEMEDWEEDMDRMMVILPIIGTAFKKTYFDPIKNTNVSELVLPSDLVVNYWAKSLEKAPRISHIIHMSQNDMKTRQTAGLFREVELVKPRSEEIAQAKLTTSKLVVMPDVEDETTPYTIIECHCNLDLDDDGYWEPYIVSFDYWSGIVLRIKPRFVEDGIKWKDDEVLSIEPIHYFTKYGFLPNPEGGFYDIGFGQMLGPINETINTSINQILDQGTMYTTGGGFLGRGVRIKGGEVRLGPNEWKTVNATVDDLRKAIFPNPVKEPSNTLFQLLGTLVESGEKVASIAEIFVGKMPGQNTPATTTMETIKQGMAVFTAIYKRIYRSFEKEIKKLARLNRIYLDENIDYPVDLRRSDYENARLIVEPTADPDIATDAEKLNKARAALELVQLGTVNPQEATRRYLEAQRQDNIPALMEMQPKPNPEMEKMKAEMQMKQQEAQMKMQSEQMKSKVKMQEAQMKLAAKARENQINLQSKQQQAAVQMRTSQNKMMMDNILHRQQMSKDMEKMELEKVQARQQAEIKSQQMKQQAEQARRKPQKKE